MTTPGRRCCRHCLYVLEGLSGRGVCPECGRPFDLDDPYAHVTFSPHGLTARLMRTVLFAGVPLLFALLLVAMLTNIRLAWLATFVVLLVVVAAAVILRRVSRRRRERGKGDPSEAGMP